MRLPLAGVRLTTRVSTTFGTSRTELAARLDCFSWSSEGYREGEFRLMPCKPFVLSLCDEEIDFVEITESPQRHIFEKIADAVELSTWMFAEGQGRLVVERDDALTPSAK